MQSLQRRCQVNPGAPQGAEAGSGSALLAQCHPRAVQVPHVATHLRDDQCDQWTFWTGNCPQRGHGTLRRACSRMTSQIGNIFERFFGPRHYYYNYWSTWRVCFSFYHLQTFFCLESNSPVPSVSKSLSRRSLFRLVPCLTSDDRPCYSNCLLLAESSPSVILTRRTAIISLIKRAQCLRCPINHY